MRNDSPSCPAGGASQKPAANPGLCLTIGMTWVSSICLACSIVGPSESSTRTTTGNINGPPWHGGDAGVKPGQYRGAENRCQVGSSEESIAPDPHGANY